MTQEHPIIPPPELVHQWHKEACKDPCNKSTFFESKTLKHIATQAARWGADQELEACCEWIHGWYGNGSREVVGNLYSARRPKPPSLKELALAALNVIEDKMLGPTTEEKLIRRALEALPND